MHILATDTGIYVFIIKLALYYVHYSVFEKKT